MINKDPFYCKQSIDTLASSLSGSYHPGTSQELLGEIARSRATIIKSSTMRFGNSSEVSAYVEGMGNAWLITSDGWMITAYHTIMAYEEKWKRLSECLRPEDVLTPDLDFLSFGYFIICGPKNTPCYIDFTEVHTDEAYDIALIKAVIQSEPVAIPHAVVHKPLKQGELVQLLAYDYTGNEPGYPQKPYQKEGRVLHTHDNHFATDIPGFKGLSGGLMTTIHSEIVGLCIAGYGTGKSDQAAIGVGLKPIHDLIKHRVEQYHKNKK